MDNVGTSMVLLANIIAILLSLVAVILSLYTLWVVRVSPFKLVVYPPAICGVNPGESSLILNLTFHNPGRVRASVLDIEASLDRKDCSIPVQRLQPQAFHHTFFPAGDVKLPQSIISRFAPITVDIGKTVSKTVYFSPRKLEQAHISQSDDAKWEILRVSFKVNGNWNKRVFEIKRSELDAHPNTQSQKSPLKIPFVPSIYPDVQPLHLRGSVFDPIY